MTSSMSFKSFFQYGKDLLGCLDFSRVVKKVENLGTRQSSIQNANVLVTLELPQIVIIGLENAGKTTTLLRILGVEVLPRAPDFCTRIAVKIKLLHDPDCVEPRLKLVLPKLDADHEFTTHEDITAEQVRDNLEQLYADIKTRKWGIVMDKFATMELRSKDVPSLNLVDLPGVIEVRMPCDDEPPNLADMTVELTRKYLGLKETGGVLCVVDAAIDNLKASKILRLLQDCRPDLQPNAVVVLTKADEAYRLNWEEQGKSGPLWRLETRLIGKAKDSIDVRGGYVALKNRDTENILQGGFLGQNEEEVKWFIKNCSMASGFISTFQNDDGGDQPQLSTLGHRHLGILALIKKLDWIISQFLSRDWVPGKLAEQEEEERKLSESLAPLGLAPEDVGLERLRQYTSEMLVQAFKPALLDDLCTASFKDLATSAAVCPSLFETVNRSRGLLQDYRDAIESDSLVQHVGEGVASLISSCFAGDQTGDMQLNRFETLKEMLISQLWVMMHDEEHLKVFKHNANKRCNHFLRGGCSRRQDGWFVDFDTLRVKLCECVILHLLLPILHEKTGVVSSTFDKLDTMPPECATMAARRADLKSQLENVGLIKDTLRDLNDIV